MSLKLEPADERESLETKNKAWRDSRKTNAAKMIGLGVVGLVVPVIPGALLIGGGLWLLFPEQTEKAWSGLKKKFGNKEGG
ncbi:MAG: hypothetical protein AAB354_05095 [candidate division KSB1 bacterium]